MNTPKVYLIFTTIFYLILVYVLFNSIQTLMDEPTTFEETISENNAELPSITICPDYPNPTNITIESFEDTLKAIEFEKKNFNTRILRTSPFTPE